MQKNNSQSGFSLIELAIVMVIIALLVGSVLVGQHLVKTATIKATISQIEDFQTSFNVFVDKFRAYPGDFSRANQFLPGATVNHVGNGNTRIEWDTAGGPGSLLEGPLSWYHMQLAGLVAGNFGTGLNSDEAAPGPQVPPSKIGGDGGGFGIDYDVGIAPITGLGNHLVLGLYVQGQGLNDQPLINPGENYDIDKKMDDGLPTTGIVRGNQSGPNACYNNASIPQYNRTSEDIVCWLTYKLD